MRRAVARVESFLPGHKSVEQRSNTYNKVDTYIDPKECRLLFFCNVKSALDVHLSFGDTFVPEPDESKADE